jgi:hypothetical protein
MAGHDRDDVVAVLLHLDEALGNHFDSFGRRD